MVKRSLVLVYAPEGPGVFAHMLAVTAAALAFAATAGWPLVQRAF